MPKVLLLRDNKDSYQSIFEAAGYTTHFLPVLEHNLLNLDTLKQTVIKTRHSGLIVTSQRAVEAWHTALKEVESTIAHYWTQIPVYTVGQTTAAALQNGFHEKVNIIGAEQSGNAENLAQLIIAAPQSNDQNLLYLTGDKTRDVIANRLSAHAIPHKLLQVYETTVRHNFTRKLCNVVQQEWDWIVMFSPSGVDASLPTIKNFYGDQISIKVAVIGPTTLQHLQTEHHLKAHACAEKPTPEALLEAIQNSQKSE